MNIGTALQYLLPEVRKEFGIRLESFVKREEGSQKDLELLLMSLMQTQPECVYKPLVEAYHSIRNHKPVSLLQDGSQKAKLTGQDAF